MQAESYLEVKKFYSLSRFHMCCECDGGVDWPNIFRPTQICFLDSISINLYVLDTHPLATQRIVIKYLQEKV